MQRDRETARGPGSIRVFTQYLLSAYYLLGTILSAGIQQEISDINSCPPGGHREEQRKWERREFLTTLTSCTGAVMKRNTASCSPFPSGQQHPGCPPPARSSSYLDSHVPLHLVHLGQEC